MSKFICNIHTESSPSLVPSFRGPVTIHRGIAKCHSSPTSLTHNSVTRVHKPATTPSLCTFFSPFIFSSFPYAKRFFHPKYKSSSARSSSSKASLLTRDMPKPSRKGKTASREVDISKSLSYLLRHGARDEGVRLDEGGWANVADVVGF